MQLVNAVKSRTSRRWKRAVLPIAALAAIAAYGPFAPQAQAAPAVKDPCGFYETSTDAYYNHCTSDGSHIVIEIDDWFTNTEMCVGPGVTWIGAAGDVDGAWYTGRTC
ncbi:DUF6355 family natural product biosynthesis protein [Streptomyces sp. NPDC044780]|uniref:DUF6355 family natural product biosynthesis protein n=1 Tax=unclassified Streptomyces TaxID=2593676 RepID=UPI0033F3553E